MLNQNTFYFFTEEKTKETVYEILEIISSGGLQLDAVNFDGKSLFFRFSVFSIPYHFFTWAIDFTKYNKKTFFLTKAREAIDNFDSTVDTGVFVDQSIEKELSHFFLTRRVKGGYKLLCLKGEKLPLIGRKKHLKRLFEIADFVFSNLEPFYIFIGGEEGNGRTKLIKTFLKKIKIKGEWKTFYFDFQMFDKTLPFSFLHKTYKFFLKKWGKNTPLWESILETISDNIPLILVLDNIHYIDHYSAELFIKKLHTLVGMPVFIIFIGNIGVSENLNRIRDTLNTNLSANTGELWVDSLKEEELEEFLKKINYEKLDISVGNPLTLIQSLPQNPDKSVFFQEPVKLIKSKIETLSREEKRLLYIISRGSRFYPEIMKAAKLENYKMMEARLKFLYLIKNSKKPELFHPIISEVLHSVLLDEDLNELNAVIANFAEIRHVSPPLIFSYYFYSNNKKKTFIWSLHSGNYYTKHKLKQVASAFFELSYAQLDKIDNKIFSLWLKSINVLISSGEYLKAMRAIEKGLSSDIPEIKKVRLLLLKAFIELKRENMSIAIESLKNAFDFENGDIRIAALNWMYRGIAFYKMGFFKDAMIAFDISLKSLRKVGAKINTRYNRIINGYIASIHLDFGEYEKAYKFIEETTKHTNKWDQNVIRVYMHKIFKTTKVVSKIKNFITEASYHLNPEETLEIELFYVYLLYEGKHFTEANSLLEEQKNKVFSSNNSLISRYYLLKALLSMYLEKNNELLSIERFKNYFVSRIGEELSVNPHLRRIEEYLYNARTFALKSGNIFIEAEVVTRLGKFFNSMGKINIGNSYLSFARSLISIVKNSNFY